MPTERNRIAVLVEPPGRTHLQPAETTEQRGALGPELGPVLEGAPIADRECFGADVAVAAAPPRRRAASLVGSDVARVGRGEAGLARPGLRHVASSERVWIEVPRPS